MKCMYCGSLDSKVIDSRLSEDGMSIRRRRECNNCARRFTTYETVEHTPVMVVKKNGDRQAFDSKKIKNGVLKACEKRPVSIENIDALVADVEKQIYNLLEQEVQSKQIGDLVMNGLKKLDDVAYVRFASVHRQFKDITTLLDEINDVLKNKDKK